MPRKKADSYVPNVTPVEEGADATPEPIAPLAFDAADTLHNARRAEALLNDPILAAAFEAVAARYRSAWENSPRGDLETQRVAHASLAALKDVIGALRAFVGGGKLFEAELEAQKRASMSGRQPY